MLPGYRADLERLRTSTPDTTHAPAIRPGDPVLIVAPGQAEHGSAGVVTKRGRLRYHVKVGDRVLTVPFSMVAASRDDKGASSDAGGLR